PRAQLYHRLALVLGHPAQAILAANAAKSPSPDGSLLIVPSKLRDAADDDRIHPQDAPQLGGAGGIGTVAVREILLGQDLVQGLALDHRVGVPLHQPVHDHVGDALANVHVAAEDL